MNNLDRLEIKKTPKSYDLKGFVRFYELTSGERGILQPLKPLVFIDVLPIFKMSAPNCAPLNLTQFSTYIDYSKFNQFD